MYIAKWKIKQRAHHYLGDARKKSAEVIKLQRIDLLLISVPKEAAILFSFYTAVVRTANSTFGFERKAKINAYFFCCRYGRQNIFHTAEKTT